MSRELDVAIAEALGYEVLSVDVQDYCRQGVECWIKLADGRSKTLPDYSSDGNAMLVLDEETRELGWYLTLFRLSSGKWVAYYMKLSRIYRAEGCEAAEAVTLAAYKALTGKDWEEPCR